MTELRDKIADVGYMGTTIGHGVADAIIAALPDMMPDLVWEDDRDTYSASSILGVFDIYCCPEYAWLVQMDGHDDSWVKYPEGDIGFPTLEAAKAAANAHYRAQIMKALGVA